MAKAVKSEMKSKWSTFITVVCLLAYAIMVPHTVLKLLENPLIQTPSMQTPSSVEIATTDIATTGDVATTAPRPHKMCVSKDLELQQLINSTSNVFVMMPCKVAGTSFTQFTQKCTGVSRAEVREKEGKNVLTNTYEVPSVASHQVYKPGFVKTVLKNASRRTLFVWLHREETSRLISATRHVVKRMCEEKASRSGYGFKLMKGPDTMCIIHEQNLLEDVIQKKIYEIGNGNDEVLTCDTYRTMVDNLPNILFVDYAQTDDLMMRIARKHCPRMLDKPPIHTNLATNGTEKKLMVHLTSKQDGVHPTVPLDDWLLYKGGYLELSLQLKANATCQNTTSRLEDALEACEDHIVRLDDEWIGRTKSYLPS